MSVSRNNLYSCLLADVWMLRRLSRCVDATATLKIALQSLKDSNQDVCSVRGLDESFDSFKIVR
jgi:hypothetical protein